MAQQLAAYAEPHTFVVGDSDSSTISGETLASELAGRLAGGLSGGSLSGLSGGPDDLSPEARDQLLASVRFEDLPPAADSTEGASLGGADAAGTEFTGESDLTGESEAARGVAAQGGALEARANQVRSLWGPGSSPGTASAPAFDRAEADREALVREITAVTPIAWSPTKAKPGAHSPADRSGLADQPSHQIKQSPAGAAAREVKRGWGFW